MLLLTAQSLLLLSLAAEVAEPRFALEGRVLDPAHAPIVAGRITALPDGPGATASALTDHNGGFTLALVPGHYSVTVSAKGFVDATAVVTGSESGSESMEFVLKLATLRESVEVSASIYQETAISSATRTSTLLRDVPQSITVATRELIKDQLMMSIGDVMRYVPGIAVHQGENNRDQVVIRGQSSSADFYLNGVRDDVQYYRDLYNLERVEALKGPNALSFGRGGGGGVVNRVTKEAGFQPIRELSAQAGGYGNKRFAADFDQPLNGKVAVRLNGLYEDSQSFRDRVGLERYALNPTFTLLPTSRTRVTLGYEHLHDRRVADRGVTSFEGAPADVDITTYYGDPNQSQVRADVDFATLAVEHKADRLTIRNRALLGDYDRGYQNFVPGAVTADKSQVALSAYNNATARQNLFNQTDFIFSAATGSVQHTLLAGAEFGRQLTDNFRNTGYFNGTAASILVPYATPTITTPVTFRQNATDADNHLRTSVVSAYAQDQIELSKRLQLLGGLRFDRFDLQYHNNRNGDSLARVDELVSPRAAVVVKPIAPMSVYGSYAVSYLPSSGDQFSSLTSITQQVEPEKFTSYEAGVKWDLRSGLSLTTSVYRLNRTNTRSVDPNDPTRIVQTGSQRTNGFELGVNGNVMGAWRIAGGYAYQDAFVTSATLAARQGAQIAQVPHHTLSLWNNYQFAPKLAAAIGLLYRTEMFAAIDNSVRLPGLTRVDAAVFYRLNHAIRIQANLENVFDDRYWINADSNTNISPGFPRTLRVAVTTGF